MVRPSSAGNTGAARLGESNLQLTCSTWDSVERLQAYGLIRRTDFPGRDPFTGTIESFRDKWLAGEVATPTYAFTLDGVQPPALPVMRHALLNPVAPVRPDPMDALFEVPTAQVTT